MIDDDALMRRVCEIGLSRNGCAVVVEENAEAAWETIQSRGFDLVITDHHMPTMTGLDLIRRMRGKKISTPSLLISGNLPSEVRESLEKLQPGDFLMKPFNVHDLIARIRTLLGPKWENRRRQ